MEEVIYYNELYDIYGELFTEKQRAYFEDYYYHNLSYSEIAENYGVSRNAAFKQIHNVTQKLDEYEKILQLKKKKEEILHIIENCDVDIQKKMEDLL